MTKAKKLTNTTIKVDKVLYLDFEKEVILSEQSKKESFEEALRDFIKKKKSQRGS
jgi:hypothetical protein